MQKEEQEEEKTRLSVAINKDEVGQQIHEIEKEINQKVKMRDNRKTKAEEYDKLAKMVNMEQSPDTEMFEPIGRPPNARKMLYRRQLTSNSWKRSVKHKIVRMKSTA